MQRTVIVLGSAAFFVAAICAVALQPPDPSTHREPQTPFRIADDLYYVGTRSLSSFLLTTSQGHILMNTGVADGVPLLAASIQQLGFSVTDIKILLVSHAHYDHVGGFAEMKRLTGAQVVALGDDAVSLERGKEVWTGGEDWPPVRVDRILQDGDVVSLGGVRLTARLTPGHTKGATTWVTELRFEGQSYPAVFVGGAGPNDGVPLVSNTVYSQVASDYAHTFRVLKELRPEFFFQPHPQGFGMEQKARRLLAGQRPNPFIDPKGYAASVQRSETTYLERLHKEQSSASPRDR